MLAGIIAGLLAQEANNNDINKKYRPFINKNNIKNNVTKETNVDETTNEEDIENKK